VPVTKFGYNASGDLVKQYQPDASALTWTYHTTWHQPLTFVNELNKTWTYTYDTTYGNLLTEQDPLGNTTTYTHTSLGLVDTHTTADPDGAGSLAASVTTSTTTPTAA
jgi:YD repeat-containing protein